LISNPTGFCGNSDYVFKTKARITFVASEIGAAYIKDLQPSVALQAIKGLRDAGRGLETCNAYIRAVKGFSRWLWREGRAVNDSLVGLAYLNVAVEEPRHPRREVSPEELDYLLAFVERSVSHHKLSGPDRATLYRVALGTGYRAGEIRSLTPDSFDLRSDPPTITVEAPSSKHRRRDVQPIRRDLAEQLERWLEDRPRDEKVFRRMPCGIAKTLRSDLDAARATWISESTTDVERQRREASQFLRYKNEAGEFADFHALRHTYVSCVVASGASIKTAMTLSRHSTPKLTLCRYAHARLHDLTAAVESMPSHANAPVQQQAAIMSCGLSQLGLVLTSLRVTRRADIHEHCTFLVHSVTFRSRKAFAMTETELRLIAAPAMIGLSSKPKNG
jgi:integrase